MSREITLVRSEESFQRRPIGSLASQTYANLISLQIYPWKSYLNSLRSSLTATSLNSYSRLQWGIRNAILYVAKDRDSRQLYKVLGVFKRGCLLNLPLNPHIGPVFSYFLRFKEGLLNIRHRGRGGLIYVVTRSGSVAKLRRNRRSGQIQMDTPSISLLWIRLCRGRE